MGEAPSSLSDVDYQIVFDASLDASIIHTSDGEILAANWTAIERYGYSLAEFKQMNIAELSAQELKADMPSKLGELQTLGEIFEWKHRRKDETELPVEIYAQPIIFYGELAILANIRDISQRKDLESELQSQNHLLERIVDTEPGTVYIYDVVAQENVYVNRHWLTAFGYTPEETRAMGAGLVELFHPDDRPLFIANNAAWRDAADGEIRSIEYRIRDKQGEWHWLLSRATPFMRDDTGQVSQVLGISHDITERKRAEALLAGQNQVLGMIASGAPLADTLTALVSCIEEQSAGMLGSILLLDPDGIHVRHGAAPSLPAEFNAAVDGQPIGPVAGSCGTAAYRKEAVFVEDIATDPLWANYKAVALQHGLRACWSTPIFDEQGQVLGTFAMYYREPGLPQAEHLHLIDATTHIAAIAINRSRAEKALKESEARLIKAQQVARMGFLEWNLNTNQIFCSDEIYDLYGIDREEEYTTPEFIRAIVHPDDLDYVQTNLELAVQGEKEYNIDHRIQRPDGSVIWVHAQAELIVDANQNKNVLLGTVVDVTERKLAEARAQRMTQLYAALSQCNQAIVRCTSEEELFPQICMDAVKFGGMKMAWIGMIDEASQLVRPVASFGAGIEYLKGLEISMDVNKATGRGPTGRCIHEDQPYWCQDFQHDSTTAAWHERGAQFSWGASASLPLHRKGKVIGAFSLYAGEVNAFDEPAKDLLVEMAMDISFALDHYASEAERMRAELALQQSEQYLRTIIETEPECVKVVDLAGRLLEMNPAGLSMLEADTLEQAREHGMGNYALPEYRDALNAMHKRVIQGEDATLEFEIKGLKGTRRWLETHETPMRDAEGNVTHLLGITLDITERKENEERIKYLANFDALTGLPNRVQLDDHLKYALSLAKRNNGQLALMFIDLDRFKDVNDTLGHSIGDAYLVEMASRLKQILREEDTASRLGGDEFILMLPDSDTQGAAQVAQKVLDIVSIPCRIDQYDLSMTASIGIAMFPDDGVDLETLSRSADTAMYRAKQEGRDRYRFFTPAMQARATRNMHLVIALRQALELEQFHLHYQPQISIDDGRIIGVEALLRWQHPELGEVSPAEFIPVAEDSGLILPIGEWVLRTALHQLKNWMDRGCAPMVVAVNLSAIQFRHPNFSEMVMYILEQEQIQAHHLELELTEGVAMYDPETAVSIMNDLHDIGIRMSIDDFGTGYSSLNYLKKFKVYKLKIDQSFVRDISTDQEDRAIVAAIVSMSKDLGLQTIAEGVETIEQLEYLRAQGCDEAQGYYFNKPLPVEEIETLLSLNKT